MDVWDAAQTGRADDLQVLLHFRPPSRKVMASALHVAARNDHAEAVDVLIRARALINDWGEDRIAPLFAAAHAGSAGAVRALLQARADVNRVERGRASNTPVAGAALGGHCEVIEILLAADADVNVRDVTGVAPLAHAADNGHLDAVELLLRAGTDIDRAGHEAVYFAAYGRRHDIVKLLVHAKASVNSRRRGWGLSLLSRAACSDRDDIVQLLLTLGADAARTGDERGTPLMTAVVCGSVKVVACLLAHDNRLASAPITVNTRIDGLELLAGDMPIDLARGYHSLEKKQIAALLQAAAEESAGAGGGAGGDGDTQRSPP